MKLSRLLTLAALVGYSYAGGLSAAELSAKTVSEEKIITPSTPPITATKTKPSARKFTSTSLYGLLTAELADSRQLYNVALYHYTQQALETRDPQIAARATLMARYANNNPAALTLALVWVETAPNNLNALENACLMLIHANRLLEAFEMSKRLQSLGGISLFQNIATSASTLTKTQRERLLQRYKNLLAHSGSDEPLLIGLGTLLQQQKHFDDAMVYTHKALELFPNSILAAILEANLLHDLGRDHEAIAKMSELLVLYPANTSLRSQYANTLTHYDIELAQQQFVILSEQLPNDAEVLLSLGITAMERKDYPTASKAFEQLLDTNQHLSQAHYYLGQMAETQQHGSDAIFNYLQVGRGSNFLPATTHLLDIFIRKGDLISAQQHMNRVRIRFPSEAKEFYLLQAQILIKHNFLRDAETILNEALALNPSDPVIINSILSTTMQRLKTENTSPTNLSAP